jgi:hypothetical protein
MDAAFKTLQCDHLLAKNITHHSGPVSGTYIPTVSGGFASGFATYQKIGQVVQVLGNLSGPIPGTTGTFSITLPPGLPFTGVAAVDVGGSARLNGNVANTVLSAGVQVYDTIGAVMTYTFSATATNPTSIGAFSFTYKTSA